MLVLVLRQTTWLVSPNCSLSAPITNDERKADCDNTIVGCDCLGVIKYLGDWCVATDGTAVEKPNSICIHEIDQGIQWKHTNHRTKNATVVRKRQLVLQQIITVANYEYIFAWIFDQSGEITFETRATGILSTQPIDHKANVPWGTRVADGVMAPYHQHLFNVRIDPAVGDDKNTLVYSDSVRMPWDKDLNPLGTGYVTKETVIHRESHLEDSVEDGRVFKVVNRNIENPVSGTPIGYKIVPIRSQASCPFAVAMFQYLSAKPLLATNSLFRCSSLNAVHGTGGDPNSRNTQCGLRSTETDNCSPPVTTQTSLSAERASSPGSTTRTPLWTKTLLSGTRSASTTSPAWRVSPLCLLRLHRCILSRTISATTTLQTMSRPRIKRSTAASYTRISRPSRPRITPKNDSLGLLFMSHNH